MAIANPRASIDGTPVLAGTQLIWAAQILLDNIRELVDELRDDYPVTATDMAETNEHDWFDERLTELTVIHGRIGPLCRAYQTQESLEVPVEWLVGARK